MELEYLPVSTENIKNQPDKFVIDLDGEEYTFEFYWNPFGEFFSYNMFDSDGELIVAGRKIVYGVDIFKNIPDRPEVEIYPLDKTGEAEKEGITFDNFMDNVKLYITGGDN